MATNNSKGKVLMIYTGGTIGMLPKEKGNSLSPLVPANWEKLKKFAPVLEEIPLDTELHEMDLIDSSDMHPDYWVDIARVIRDNYEKFDGFVILHGTDTMTYTATALSFLLENLDKPVIVTGSQLSIGTPRSDALQNLVTSLTLAAPKSFNLPLIPEVCICFNNVILRGNRARKVSSSGYSGFDTPNYPSLGKAGEHIDINTKVIRKPSTKGFFINESLEKNVMLFDIFPGISPEILNSVFSIDGLKGVVFRTYGAGNAPTNEDFLKEIEKAVNKKNLALVNITQCNQGMVEMGLYDASATLSKLGVISGVDMTPEAALVKMMFLLGLGYDIETVKDQMQKDLRGEQSVDVFNFVYENGKADKLYKAPAKQLPAGFDKERIVSTNIRIDEAALPKEVKQAEIELAVFMNYPSADENTDTSISQCLGVLKGTYNEEPVNLILGCTERFRQVVTPGRPIQITIVAKNEHAVRWDGAFISVYTSVE
ncbi:MAG: asparaginase [bacterium]|nr:asparaginase [bacterium]